MCPASKQSKNAWPGFPSCSAHTLLNKMANPRWKMQLRDRPLPTSRTATGGCHRVDAARGAPALEPWLLVSLKGTSSFPRTSPGRFQVTQRAGGCWSSFISPQEVQAFINMLVASGSGEYSCCSAWGLFQPAYIVFNYTFHPFPINPVLFPL